MKTFLIIIILFPISFNGYAQEDEIIALPQRGIFDEDLSKVYYYKDIDNDLNKFLGTWKYTSTTKEFSLTFYLNTHVESGGTYDDEIYAKFKYSENGNVIYDFLSDVNAKYFSGSSIDLNDRNKIGMLYDEPTDIVYDDSYPFGPSLDLEYLPCIGSGCMPQLKWHIDFALQNENEIWPFKMPTDLVLIKQ